MLGLTDKGHLGPGADADVCVVNPDNGSADLVISGGHVIADTNHTSSGGTKVLALDCAADELERQRVPHACVAPAWLGRES